MEPQPLTDDEVKALFVEYRATGSEAIRNRIVEDTMPKMARFVNYIHDRKFRNYDLDDMLQEAWLIVMESVRAFDTTIDVPFIKYVCTAIGLKLPGVTARVAGHHPLSRHDVTTLARFWREHAKLMRAGEPHSAADVYRSLGWEGGEKLRRFDALLRISGRNWVGTSTVDAEGFSAMEVIPDTREGRERAEQEEEDRAHVARLLRTLRPPQVELLRQRFGIGCQPREMGEMARERGVTYESVRKPVVDAIAELKIRSGIVPEGYTPPEPVRVLPPLPPLPPPPPGLDRWESVQYKVDAVIDLMHRRGEEVTASAVAHRAKVCFKSVKKAMRLREASMSAVA